MLEKLRVWIHELNIIPCKCGCKDDHWNIKDSIEGTACEAEIVCDNCGTVINYWAYGYVQHPETYTELFREKVRDILYRMNPTHYFFARKIQKLIKIQRESCSKN